MSDLGLISGIILFIVIFLVVGITMDRAENRAEAPKKRKELDETFVKWCQKD